MESSYDNMMRAKSFLPFRMGYLTDWMVKKAEEELNETEETRTQALKELRNLITKERNLNIWTDDAYLLQFLRARKFEPDRAMEVIRNFYTMLKNYPEVFPKTLDRSYINSLMHTETGGPYPYRHQDGGVVFFLSASNWDPDQFPILLNTPVILGIILSLSEDPATQVCGVHIIYDAEFKLKHLRANGPKFIRLFNTALRDTLPLRIKTVHIVNGSVIFNYFFSIFKIFMSEKMKKRFYCHGRDMKQLHQYIPKEILPPHYGGDNLTFSASEFCKKETVSYIDRFEEMLNKGYS